MDEETNKRIRAVEVRVLALERAETDRAKKEAGITTSAEDYDEAPTPEESAPPETPAPAPPKVPTPSSEAQE